MNCKNCQNHLSDTDKYCPSCAGKVVKERFSIKMLLEDASKEIFGWDNKLFVTIKYLIVKPEVLLKEYLSGTRKKFVNPIAFLTIGAAASILFFNIFSEEYLAFSTSMDQADYRSVGESVGRGLAKTIKGSEEQGKIVQIDSLAIDSLLTPDSETSVDSSATHTPFRDNLNKNIQETILKYYNIFTYLVLPFYALLAFWVFGKPYNYAEHLVIACFLQGFSFLTGVLTFLFSVLINPNAMAMGILLSMAYYSYAYGRLYKHSFGQVILKFLKFLLILAAVGVVFAIILILVMLLFASLGYELPR